MLHSSSEATSTAELGLSTSSARAPSPSIGSSPRRRAAFPLDDTRYEELQVTVCTWKDRAIAYAREQEQIRDIRRGQGPDFGLGR
ncbi:MAG: hypothetical protein ACYCST_01115 [Acidimicrobiales bacterium]